MTTAKTLTPMQQLDNAIAILESGEVRQGCALVYQAARAAVDAAAARHGISCPTHLDAYNFILALDGIPSIASYDDPVELPDRYTVDDPLDDTFPIPEYVAGFGVAESFQEHADTPIEVQQSDPCLYWQPGEFRIFYPAVRELIDRLENAQLPADTP